MPPICLAFLSSFISFFFLPTVAQQSSTSAAKQMFILRQINIAKLFQILEGTGGSQPSADAAKADSLC